MREAFPGGPPPAGPSAAMTSMRRSLHALLMGVATLGLLALVALQLPWAFPRWLLAPCLALSAVALALLAASAHLAVARQRRVEAGTEDMYLQANRWQSEEALAAGATSQPSPMRRSLARALFGHHLLVGDAVEVRSLPEIRATLDKDACLEGLPFMPEMEIYCGTAAKVFRVVDKIYDYGRSKRMRRLDNCVLLLGLRCDGSGHDDCQAACYLIWNTAWLKPVPAGELAVEPAKPAKPIGERQPHPLVPGKAYRCQYTQLTTASREQAPLTWHGLIGPLVAGNVSFKAFSVALSTRVFNAFQEWRGGIAYPAMPGHGGDKSMRGDPLKPGDRIRVRRCDEIARSLDRNSKNRGLWFDRDMAKFCGQSFQVRGRVHQIIDITTHTMIPMKSPCIMLETVHFTGEFQGFGEQHDYLYWREAWLERIAPQGV